MNNSANELWAVDDVLVTGTTATTIATGDPSTPPVCSDGTSTLSVPFTVTGAAPTGTYSVQLSDAAGSFTSPTALTTTGSASPLTATIPAGLAGGTGYKVRVLNGSITGSPNTTAFTINGVTIAPVADQTTFVNTNGTTLTATENPAGASRQWYYGTAATGPYSTAITGATGTSYTPNFPTVGVYYVVVQTAFATPACTLTSNAVKVTVSAPTITTGNPTTTPVCASSAATISVPFTVGGTLTGTYSVQLSDPNGSFTSPTTLASTGTASPLTATIPAGTASGTGYLVRVLNSAPATIGATNPTAFTIVSNPTVTISPNTPQTIATGGSVSFSATETPAATSRQWKYGTTSGTYPTNGGTGSTYSFAPTTNGVYYVVVTSTFPGCGAVTSAETQVTVNNPVPTINAGGLSPASAIAGSTVTTLTVTGTNFVPNSVITFNGTALTTSYSSSTQLTASNVTVPATPGTYSVTVTNPTPGGGTSAAVAFTATAPPTYTWNGTGTSWIAAGSWTPARNTVSTDDRLLFDGAITPTVTLTADFTTGQTVAQLAFRNNVMATFNTSANRTLNVSNGVAGADLSIEANSSLTLFNPSTASAVGITLALGTGATATVAGALTFDAGTAANVYGAHQLLGSGTSSIVFTSGSYFYQTVNFTGSPFGSTTTYLNNVQFSNGSGLYQAGGSQPFGTTAPNTIVVLQPTSTYYYWVPTTTSTPPLANRTFGNLVFDTNAGTTASSTAASPLTIVGDLSVLSGTTGLNLAATISIGGNITVANGATLGFGPAATRTITLNGTSAQTITNAGTLTFSANANLQVNNAAGVTLASPLTLTRFQLTTGNLTTSAANLLTLTSTATLSGGSATSFVNGPLARATATGASTVPFPIGQGTAYRPLTLNITAQSAATTYTAVQTEGMPTDQDLTKSDLTRISKIRYFSVTPAVAPTTFNGTITLSFGSDDQVTDPTLSTFVVGQSDGLGWYDIGQSSATGTSTAGTLTSAPFMGFSDFILASNLVLTPGNIGVNPLPVQLTRFTATRAAKGVQLAWATASELNSARFEVERSLDGKAFVAVARVAAQGSSTQAHEYAALDGTAPAALLYYRLRQVDLDGMVAYSPVVTVAGTDEATAAFTLTPNPARERISFLTAAPTAYTLRNTLGQVVRTGTTLAGPNTVAVSELPAGIYFFELHGQAGRVVRKFVKE